jgi:phospholipase/lecithinase/hemolysin
MRIAMSMCLLAAALVPFAATTVPISAKASFERVVAFGTSLSDSGNAFALRGEVNTPPDYQLDPLLVPGAPYARGGHHFSNGATWIEQFARSTGLAGTVRPAFASLSPKATNFAVGGARAYEDGININLGAQVGTFLQQSGGGAASDALYTIEIGGNDIRDALAAFAGGGNGTGVLEDAILAIARNIQALYGAGARTFLVWRAPNVGVTPAIRTLDRVKPGAAQLGLQLTQAFNAGLDGVVAQLSTLPGIRIVRLDAYRLLNDIVADPAAFGLIDVMTACVTPNDAPFICDRPDEFLFWDGIHPTRAAHAIIAQEAAAELAQ